MDLGRLCFQRGEKAKTIKMSIILEICAIFPSRLDSSVAEFLLWVIQHVRGPGFKSQFSPCFL